MSSRVLSQRRLPLQEAVQTGARSQQGHFTMGDAVWQLLRAPFAEQRSAVCQMLAVLCARGWASLEVVLHAELLRWLLDPGSETSKQARASRHTDAMQHLMLQHPTQLCEWRFAVVTSLAATLHWLVETGAVAQTHQSHVRAVHARVQGSLRQGPFGAGRGAPAQHLFETA